MDWPASDASVYAMIPFRKLRRSVSTENGDISRDYNADTAPIRIGVSRTAIYGHVLVLGPQSEAEPPAKWGYLGTSLVGPTRSHRFTGTRLGARPKLMICGPLPSECAHRRRSCCTFPACQISALWLAPLVFAHGRCWSCGSTVGLPGALTNSLCSTSTARACPPSCTKITTHTSRYDAGQAP